eukprot:m.162243 g.162243  ORF g.162243 m.162243 type:complete len:328 (-) comp31269_c2_seq2:27-1010(-)
MPALGSNTMSSVFVSVVLLAVGVNGDYCPSENDLTIAYTTPTSKNQLNNGGWMNKGGGGVATKSSFNLLGGSVDFDIDVSQVKVGVNANIYTISPEFKQPYFNKSFYCDGAATGDNWCTEVDWIESNGNCGGQTTLHTVEGPGTTGCTAWGCANSYHYNGTASFHMRIEYDLDGKWTTVRNGETIYGGNMNPQPRDVDWATLKEFYTTKGAVIYSTIWTGWVPVSDCGTQPGDLDNSFFTISNLRINGTVVQGPIPTQCGGPSPGPSPPPPPPPPSPPPTCQDPNDGKTSDGTPCSKQKQYGNCAASWMKGWCCATCFNCTGSNHCG